MIPSQRRKGSKPREPGGCNAWHRPLSSLQPIMASVILPPKNTRRACSCISSISDESAPTSRLVSRKYRPDGTETASMAFARTPTRLDGDPGLGWWAPWRRCKAVEAPKACTVNILACLNYPLHLLCELHLTLCDVCLWSQGSTVAALHFLQRSPFEPFRVFLTSSSISTLSFGGSPYS